MGADFENCGGSCHRGGHQVRFEGAPHRDSRQCGYGQRRALWIDGGLRRCGVAPDVSILGEVREEGVTISRPQAADCRPCKVKC